MSAVVSKSSPVVVVGQSEPATPASIINLSSFDNCFVPFPTAALLLFDQPIDDTIETIKKALSQALVHYHPMAGRLATGADGELHIACTGEGVSFVAASASCSLVELSTTSPQLLKDLTLRYPGEYCSLSDALLLMQVTEFSCGGFAVGVTWNHLIADGVGMAQFLQAIGELARGMPAPSVVPVRFDGSLPCLPQPMVAWLRSQMRIETEEMVSLDVTISSSLISRVKAECGDCTTFEAVAAVLWRCRTRATMSDSEAPALLVFLSNVRDVVGAKDGFYGNCLTMQFVQATSGAVANGDIKDLVKLIRLAKEKIPDLYKNVGSSDEQQQVPPSYNILTISSWRNLGFDTVDFGSGIPARVLWQGEKTVALFCYLCPPCKGKYGLNVISLCVKPEHANSFLGELAALNI
ncbi:acyl transferase 15-like [Lolium rigidum]|uniref:acyl transferase 15-like n=1 Tax=Lolium rigidum TaxID=89674 RepID=UPI001F5D35C8|nr:acyl transferase 15-like [Lolium rigidum]